MINGTKIIALCTSRLNDGSTHEFVIELNKRLVKNNCRLFIYHLCSDYYWLEEYMSADSSVFELIDFDIVDAVILMDEKIKSVEITNNIINDARKNNIPVVTIDSNYADCVNVSYDYKKGFEQIVRHVVEEHHVSHPHFMAGYKDNSYSNDRIEVFKKVLLDNNIPFDYDMVSYGDFWADPTRKAMEELLDKGNVPDAIICANDIMAVNVSAVLKEHGYKIPEDTIVTGFDGIDEIFFLQPQITSCICNHNEMADIIMEILQASFEGRELEQQYFIVPEFLPAESCGCKNTHRKNNDNYLTRINTRFYRYQDDNKIFSYIAEKMQLCLDLQELSELLRDDALKDTTCVINKSCNDSTISSSDLDYINKFDDDLIVIRDSLNEDAVPFDIQKSDMYKDVAVLLDKKVPIIFNALCSINRLLGFVCFYFDNLDITSYGKIPQMIMTLSNGIIGYMNVQHQRYLRSKVEETYKRDSLTGLYNRMGFNTELEKLVKRVRETGETVTAILSDLNGLKVINDTYGHVQGDKAIQLIADALRHACPSDALIVRLGGDEMLAVIVGRNDPNAIKAGIKKYLDDINKTMGLPYEVSTSVGAYQTNNVHALNIDNLVIQADREMYLEKKAHHNSRR